MSPLLDAKIKGRKALIHVAKKQLGLDEDTYRALLLRITHADSCKDLNLGQLDAVVKELKAKGFVVKGQKAGQAVASQPTAKKIRSLWLQLRDAGALRDSSERALVAFVKNQTQVDTLHWLTPAQSYAVIERLKQWLARLPAKAGAP